MPLLININPVSCKLGSLQGYKKKRNGRWMNFKKRKTVKVINCASPCCPGVVKQRKFCYVTHYIVTLIRKLSPVPLKKQILKTTGQVVQSKSFFLGINEGDFVARELFFRFEKGHIGIMNCVLNAVPQCFGSYVVLVWYSWVHVLSRNTRPLIT